MALDISPRFTVSMRGYDKEEVERYLATVSERSSQSDDQLYELQEQNRYLEEEHERLAARVEELEAAIRSETPHTVGALGERITLILNEAEEGASETLAKARTDAERIIAQAQVEADMLRRQAEANATEAADTLTAARRQADELTQRLELEAKARASSILNDAEHRAQRRQDQIEKWAQEMIAHTQSEQARMADEFAMVRREHEAEVRTLTGDRDDAIAALRALQGSLAQAVERVVASRPKAQPLDEPDAAPPAAAIDLTTSIEPAPVPVGQLSSGSGATAMSALSPGARFIDEDDEQSATGPSPVLGLNDPTAGTE
jgi:DivIVA domain-containing protein